MKEGIPRQANPANRIQDPECLEVLFTVRLLSIIDLSKLHGLYLYDVEIIDSQGGSIRCYLSNDKKISHTFMFIRQ